MSNNKQYILIIFTAIFSILSLVADQFTFQIEKLIITKEEKVSKYKNYIDITKQNYLYFENAYKNLNLELEFLTKGNILEEKNAEKLNFLLNDFKIYTNNDESFFVYLLQTSGEQIKELKENFNNKILKKDLTVVDKIYLHRNLISNISEIHLDDMIKSETYWAEDYNEINGYRALRQIIIVLAFMMNICALLCLLNYFKIFVQRKICN